MNTYNADGGGVKTADPFKATFGSGFGLSDFKSQLNNYIGSANEYMTDNNVVYKPIAGFKSASNNDSWVVWIVIGFVVALVVKILFD